jgi:thiol:disulfide interchange protein DsbC
MQTLWGNLMKRLIPMLAVALTTTLFAPLSMAQSAQDNIKKTLEPKLQGGAKVESVSKTPIPGLYEVRVGGDVVYMDESGKYLLQGSLSDVVAGRNITKERTEQFQSEADKVLMPTLWSQASLKNAIKQVKGNGSRKLVLFEDPNCGYCKKMRHSLEGLNDVTVYTFVIPILSEDSAKKTRDLVCSADKSKAYDDWMLRGKAPVAAAKNCEDPTDAVMELSQKLKVRGTPAVFFADGSRAPGFMPAEQLEQRLGAVKAVY